MTKELRAIRERVPVVDPAILNRRIKVNGKSTTLKELLYDNLCVHRNISIGDAKQVMELTIGAELHIGPYTITRSN